jgi:SulP family sulfate permease
LPFLGVEASANGVVGVLQTLLSIDPATIDLRALSLATAMLALIVFWPARFAKIIPSPLGVLVIGTGVAIFALPNLAVIGVVPSALPSVSLPAIDVHHIPQLLQPAFILALLGSIDSLLTSLVADSLTKTQHDSDKELVGQGLGNLVAGLVGAIPGAGATMRTVVNIRAGGRTAISGVLHSLILLCVALGLGPVVAHVPYAVLAAILMKVGWDIIDWGYWKRLRRVPRDKAVVMLVTFGLTVFVDLITAVAVGIIFASFVNARWLADEQLKGLKQSFGSDDVDLLTPEEKLMLRQVPGRVLVTLLHGSFSYASARELARQDLQATTDLDAVVYDFTHSGYIDPSAALAIDEMVELSIRQGRHVILSGLGDSAMKVLGGMGVLDRVPAEHHFEIRKDAIEAAVEHCLYLESQTEVSGDPNPK